MAPPLPPRFAWAEAPLIGLSARWDSDPDGVRALARWSALEALALAAAEPRAPPATLLSDPRTRDALADAVLDELPKLVGELRAARDPPDAARRFAGLLEGRGPKGRAVAARTLREGGGITVAQALRRLAYTLWWAGPRQRAIEDAIRRYPGLPLPLLDGPGLRDMGPARVEEAGDGRSLVVGCRGGVVIGEVAEGRGPGLPVDLLDRLDEWTRDGAALFGSVLFARLLLWLQWEVHARWLPGHSPVIEVDGWGRLAREVRARDAIPEGGTHKDADALRAIACFLDGTRFQLPDGGVGRLLALHYRERGGRGRPHRFALVPGAPLLPGYVLGLPQRARKVVPALRHLPPLVGRANERGAVAALALHLVAEMRRRCSEMAGDREGEDLGLPMDDARWRALADRARVPLPTLAAARERWHRDGPDGPALLREVSRGRVTLAPAHEEARLVLVHYGRRERAGREAGLRSARERDRRPPGGRRRGGMRTA